MTVDEINAECDKLDSQIAALRAKKVKLAEQRKTLLADEEKAHKLARFSDEEIKSLGVTLNAHMKGVIDDARKLRGAAPPEPKTVKTQPVVVGTAAKIGKK